ncbi:hypothetical protein ACFWM3_07200 [Gottfriedia sp. NPDC058432]|uniref:hypothetical protein n=1 Tax=Gottfriedia sp. NPDC058432 TaxID=3346497 RepID=UPI003647C7E3
MKKILYSILSVLLVFSFISRVSAEETDTTTQNQGINEQKENIKSTFLNLTEEQKIERFSKIDKEYDIGEPFDLEDQVFIEMFAEKQGVQKITPYASFPASKSKTVNGVTVKVSGNVSQDINNFINQSFGANVKTQTTAGATKVNSIKTVVYHNAYGIVGSKGVGKVYDGTLSTSGKNTTLNATKKYTAVVVYASTWCEVTVNHAAGTFTVNP